MMSSPKGILTLYFQLLVEFQIDFSKLSLCLTLSVVSFSLSLSLSRVYNATIISFPDNVKRAGENGRHRHESDDDDDDDDNENHNLDDEVDDEWDFMFIN